MNSQKPNMETSGFEEAQATPERAYSPFWPCLIVFLAILIANIFQVTLLFAQNEALRVTRQNTIRTAERVLAAQTRIENLAKDLIELAKTNETAQKVVQDFNIQLTSQALEEQEAAGVEEN